MFSGQTDVDYVSAEYIWKRNKIKMYERSIKSITNILYKSNSNVISI